MIAHGWFQIVLLAGVLFLRLASAHHGKDHSQTRSKHREKLS